VRDIAANLERTDAYRYELPPELIARAPADPPDAARLMIVRGAQLEHAVFADLPAILRAGDVLAINETRVIRARLLGRREPGGGRAEILLLRPAGGGRFDFAAREWEALVRPGRRLRPGARVVFGEEGCAQIAGVARDGVRVVVFELRVPLAELLERHGTMPLPPYVGPGDEARAARYQTIFARVPGSVAAPTASLHFTPRVLAALRAKGVDVARLVLDVGLGTFRPIESATLGGHAMHAERYAIPPETAALVTEARRAGRRIVAAGTTALRALEASALGDGYVQAGEAETDLFIRPGFDFRVADALLTNFHLPGSTLLVLVSAFAGYETTMHAYQTAIAERYRMYSFGDAMFCERATGR
jgi:S-adenosylmethionine:tRNA ribosyltransferase-isomerase